MPKRILFSYLQLSNIGCEIIVRGTIRFLSQTFPDQDLAFVIPSYHVERDRKLLADIANVRVIPMLTRKRILRGVLRKLGLFPRLWTPRFASAEFRQADLFVSVGGDIYTIFDGALPQDWIGYERYATRHGIPSLMFGANMERFELLSAADRDKMVAHLKRFKAVILRDLGTVEYLNGFGIDGNVDFHPDPAFLLRQKPVFRRQPIARIAINYTPILAREFGQDGLTRFKSLTTALVLKGYEVSFVPHVYSSEGHAGLSDPQALNTLFQALAPEIRERISFIDDNLSYERVGRALQDIDLFVGGRMHGCLNALTLGKAVCFVGYSKKVRTMVDWLASTSPFTAVAQSFAAVAADAIDIDWVERLIAAHDSWAAEDPGGTVTIDIAEYLQGLSAGSTARVLTSL